MARKAQSDADRAVELVNKKLGDCKGSHDIVVDRVERNYQAYRGLPDPGSLAASFTSQTFPKYLTQLVEAMVAAMLDPNPRVTVRPRPKIGESYEAQKVAAQTLEYLCDYALDRDQYDHKERANVWQAVIAGASIKKISWRRDTATRHRLAYLPTTVRDDQNMPLGVVDQLQEHASDGVVFDGPTVEVRDIRDFYWPESAVDVQTCDYVIDRVWVTKNQAAELAAQHGHPVEELPTDTWQPAEQRRENRQGRSRTKGLLPVDECWWNDRVVTVLNGQLLLRDEPNPYWHRKKPFVVTSALPEPFQFMGFSIVELGADQQEVLWSLINQRMDSLRLMANMIMLVRSDVADVDAFEWAPGAIWPLEDTAQVKPLEINPQVAEMTINAEQLVKGDLQNIPGGSILAGADSGTVDQKTATGVTIVSSIANKLVQARQQQFRYGHRDVVEMVASNLQQFMREPEKILIAGSGATLDVDPVHVQGDFDYVLDVTDESVVRQERQAEAQALMGALGQVAQLAMLSGTKIDWTTLLQDLLESGYGVPDGSRYISDAQPASQPGMTPAAGPAPAGVTSPLATAPSAPSAQNGNSLNPAVQMQRALARTGGPANQPAPGQ